MIWPLSSKDSCSFNATTSRLSLISVSQSAIRRQTSVIWLMDVNMNLWKSCSWNSPLDPLSASDSIFWRFRWTLNVTDAARRCKAFRRVPSCLPSSCSLKSAATRDTEDPKWVRYRHVSPRLPRRTHFCSPFWCVCSSRVDCSPLKLYVFEIRTWMLNNHEIQFLKSQQLPVPCYN